MHALQNHDEMTYELVHFAAGHKDDVFGFRGEQVTGAQLAVTIRQDLIDNLTGDNGPYNATFTTNGIASTTATIIAASLGFTDLSRLSEDDVEQIKQAHLLLAMFNAWQPGVFALSGWDLCGMLTLERKQVGWALSSGDTRWIHRSAYDLMDYRPEASESLSKMPRGVSLYGSLPAQLRGPEFLRLPVVPDPDDPASARDRHRGTARRAAGVEQGDARAGAPAGSHPAGDRAELLTGAHLGQHPLQDICPRATWSPT